MVSPTLRRVGKNAKSAGREQEIDKHDNVQYYVLIDLDYKARLEEGLDKIARGEAQWEEVVTEASLNVARLARGAGLWYDPFVPGSPKAEAK